MEENPYQSPEASLSEPVRPTIKRRRFNKTDLLVLGVAVCVMFGMWEMGSRAGLIVGFLCAVGFVASWLHEMRAIRRLELASRQRYPSHHPPGFSTASSPEELS